MPKELIYGTALPYGEEDPGRSVVDVRWNRESGYMQIATKCVRADDESDYHKPLEPMAEWEITATPGVQVSANSSVEMLEVEGISTTGWYVDLDRKGINDLIRVLRRARDQAFGRDE